MSKRMIAAVTLIAGGAIGAGITAKIMLKETYKYRRLSDKHMALYMLMNQWLKTKQSNKSISEYLLQKGYREIAIYGLNYVGETLLAELEDSDIHVKYGIDKNADNIYLDVNVVLPSVQFEVVDAVIVTPITFFDEIKEMLSSKLDCEILSLADILDEIV